MMDRETIRQLLEVELANQEKLQRQRQRQRDWPMILYGITYTLLAISVFITLFLFHGGW